jgi:aspartyl-tRNA(Asn)/glutamyl-tRNA(Gln) amidotransferase subunit C
MKVNTQLVERLADLAKLEFDEEARKDIEQDLAKIIGFVDKLSEVDTEGVAPLVHVNEDVNILREDQPKRELTQEQALKNAPVKDSDYIKVPKVLKKT